MKKLRFFLLLTTIALTMLWSSVSSADLLYDNITYVNSTYPGFGGWDPVDGNGWGPLADSFSTGNASNLTLNQVQVVLSNAGSVTGTTSIDLVADNGTAPGAVLFNIGQIDDSAISSTGDIYTFTAPSSYTLAANTRYWIELSSSNGASAEWAFTANADPANEYFYNQAIGVSPSSIGPYLMTVTSVPVPGAFIMFATGIFRFVATRKRM